MSDHDKDNAFLLDDLEGLEGLDDFDPAEHLTSKEAVAAYMTQMLKEGDMTLLKQALDTVARAEGMAKVATSAGITREGAYKALRPSSKPYLETFVKLLGAVGLTIQIVPKEVDEAHATDNSYALVA
ncbi:MAG: addiction module antidote protein [Pseudomonadota bacterium]